MELLYFLSFAIKSLSGAYLWKYRKELNETWYIDRRPSEKVQNAGKDAWASICPAICPSGAIFLTYTLDARLIFFDDFYILCWKSLTREHKTEFLCLMV